VAIKKVYYAFKNFLAAHYVQGAVYASFIFLIGFIAAANGCENFLLALYVVSSGATVFQIGNL
jgi:hypothetical protein